MSVDDASLQTFLKSANGAAYASSYAPGATYTQIGSNIYSGGATWKPNQVGGVNTDSSGTIPPVGGMTDPAGSGSVQGGTNVTAFMMAYQAWLAGQNQTAANWKNYAETVSANAGGEGDNTITSGAAVGQREALMGVLAQPTAPTPGMTVAPQQNKMGVVR